MPSYPGIYRAKGVSLNGTKLTAYVPQVFGDATVVIEEYVGQLGPTGLGWVLFHGGNPEMPVWMGGGNGAQGPPGPPGPPGTGGTGTVAYVHNQGVAAATWTIDHGLSFRPNVTVVDSAGDTVDGNITYPLLTRVVLTFSGAFSGVAYLS